MVTRTNASPKKEKKSRLDVIDSSPAQKRVSQKSLVSVELAPVVELETVNDDGICQYLQDYLPIGQNPFLMLVEPADYLVKAERQVFSKGLRGRVYRPVERAVMDRPKRLFDVFEVDPETGELYGFKEAELVINYK